MPDVQEVFRMATQKVRPDAGFVDRQQQRQRRQTRNRKLGALAAVAVIGIVAIGFILGSRAQNHTTPGDQKRILPTSSFPFFLDLQTGATTLLYQPGGFYYDPSPDGTKLVYNTCCYLKDVAEVLRIDGTPVRRLDPRGNVGYYGPRWSPDGTELVYQERNSANNSVGNLFVEELATGQRTQITDLALTKAEWWYLSPRFSPDGRTVIFQMPRGPSSVTNWDVWSVPVVSGASPTRPQFVLRDASFPMYFPDGKTIAFVDPGTQDFSGPSLSIADASGARRTLVEANVAIWAPSLSPDGTQIAYGDGGTVYIVDVSTGSVSDVAQGDNAQWIDNATLIVSPG